ncbi:AEC family transporter [Salisediminibacterium selenitireducens]|uniref:Auxin Efflux Carrier n=1 Tax=Bacillus selenitireducens (strain ATCC 700615 / DSM 15326 / MLS10) TaxID=439292 RepID=D6XYH4_BACIE|nr:AEC family transporter [Salisediminibacterium selenitireducens]ADI00243.1 Auxin Efflux Carrier [[Bacillus] selenitireducens MLS10]
MTIFIQVVLPVLLVFGAGFAIQKWQKVDIAPLSMVALYVATPALVFQTFYEADLDRQYGFMVIFALLLLFSLIAINKAAASLTKASSTDESAWILSTAFMNSGNYGAPIILFAYGQEGFAFAVSFMVLQSIIMNIFGVYYAAKGRAGARYALRSVLGMPVTYAVLAGVFTQWSGLTVPDNLMGTVNILAEAAIPMVMIILGMQLANMSWSQFEWRPLSYAVTVRLLLSPIIAYGLTLLFPFDPLLQNVLIVSAAMPSAATIVMYAVRFDSKPAFISSVTLVSTLLSVLTVTLLLMLLN